MYFHIKKAEHLKDYIVRFTFETNETFDIDLKPLLKGPIFEPLNDLDYFKKFSVHPEAQTITWPNDADLAPDALYAHAKAHHKSMA